MSRIAPLLALLLAAGSAAAQTGILVQASVTAPVGVRALLTVDGKEQDLFLVRRDGDHLYFRLPQSPANALAAVRVDTIQATEFPFEIDETAAFEATRTRQWERAAEVLLAAITPCLPFLDLPRNNGLEPAIEAGFYLMRAAAAATRASNGVVTPAALALYERALAVFTQAARADGSPLQEEARLRASLCHTACGRLEEAQRLFDAARLPDPGDGDYGLWQLARASLLFARNQFLDAADAAARSVVFENKDPRVFPDALLLSARCYEELMDYYRARDVYFETARLFGSTEWGEIALARLRFIMDNQLTAEKEKANIAKVFFGSEEDMDALVQDFLRRLPPEPDTPPSRSTPNPPKDTAP